MNPGDRFELILLNNSLFGATPSKMEIDVHIEQSSFGFAGRTSNFRSTSFSRFDPLDAVFFNRIGSEAVI